MPNNMRAANAGGRDTPTDECLGTDAAAGCKSAVESGSVSAAAGGGRVALIEHHDAAAEFEVGKVSVAPAGGSAQPADERLGVAVAAAGGDKALEYGSASSAGGACDRRAPAVERSGVVRSAAGEGPRSAAGEGLGPAVRGDAVLTSDNGNAAPDVTCCASSPTNTCDGVVPRPWRVRPATKPRRFASVES